jgi:flagellar motor switch protein FliM
MQGDHLAVDTRWVKTLGMQIQAAEIELIALLGETRTTVERVLKMKVGDVIPLHVPENLVASVAGIPVMECKYGVSNNQYSLRVVNMLAAETTDLVKEKKYE